MQQVTESRAKGFFRSSPSTAFDQYLHDIQKLPLITDPAEERRLARLAQGGDATAAELVGGLADQVGQRDLDLHVLAGLHGGDGLLGVHLRRRAQDHRVDVVAVDGTIKLSVNGKFVPTVSVNRPEMFGNR